MSERPVWVVSTAVMLAASTWFSGTAAVVSLAGLWELSDSASAWLTISTQLGFIVGTLVYSLLNIADVFNSRRVFFVSAVLGALANAGFAWLSSGVASAIVFRFLTGVTLAGVYPVGMKIIASFYREGLGLRLGIMVGALTLGTAAPYLAVAIGASYDWRFLATTASVAALVGGVLMLVAIGDGPHLRSKANFDWRMLFRVFSEARFRNVAMGYFGHMWELYAFWALLAQYLQERFAGSLGLQAQVPLLAFVAIAVGFVGCVLGGLVSKRVGERRVAIIALTASGLMCLGSGLAFTLPVPLLIAYVVLWGIVVVADSPQFSALAARTCPPEYTGTALTVQNGVGFAITIVSIQLLAWIGGEFGWQWSLMLLALGPLVGVIFTTRVPKNLKT